VDSVQNLFISRKEWSGDACYDYSGAAYSTVRRKLENLSSTQKKWVGVAIDFPVLRTTCWDKLTEKKGMACLRKKLVIAYRADVRALEGAVIWKAACAGWEDWERLAAAAGGGGQAARNDGCA
jgi:hypothetical protein